MKHNSYSQKNGNRYTEQLLGMQISLYRESYLKHRTQMDFNCMLKHVDSNFYFYSKSKISISYVRVLLM